MDLADLMRTVLGVRASLAMPKMFSDGVITDFYAATDYLSGCTDDTYADSICTPHCSMSTILKFGSHI